jgi:MFS family permease
VTEDPSDGPAIPEPETQGTWARRTFAAFSSRDYRYFFVGMAVSSVGTWARTAAQQWLVWRMTGSETWLAWVSAASLLPIALASIPAGALADRHDRRRVLLGLQWAMFAISSALAALVAAGRASPGLLVAAAGVLGALRGVEMPFRQSYLVEIVGRGTLRNAVALNSIMFNLPLILGPSLAGEILATAGPTPVFVLDAVSYLAPILGFTLIRTPRRAPAPVRETVLEQILAGVRHLHGLRPARTLLALLASAMFFGWSYTSLLPAYADLLAPGDAALYGRLYSVGGVGAVLGAVWIAGRHTANPVRLVTLVLAGFALSLVAMGAWPGPAVAFPARAAAGFCMIAFFATANSTLQLSVPDGLRGRVMALWTFTFGLSLPLGQQAMGALAQHTSVRTSFVVGGAVVLAAAATAAALHGLDGRQRSRSTT